MASNFAHTTSGLTLGSSRTLIYGPVPAATSVIVFSGTFANNDVSNKAQHTVTLEKYDGSLYTQVLTQAPLPWGSSLKCPKIVLNTGDSLYGTADAAAFVVTSLELLVNT